MFNLTINNKNNQQVYTEYTNPNNWSKSKFDKNNNEIYFENSDGFWEINIFNKSNERIFYKNIYTTKRSRL